MFYTGHVDLYGFQILGNLRIKETNGHQKTTLRFTEDSSKTFYLMSTRNGMGRERWSRLSIFIRMDDIDGFNILKKELGNSSSKFLQRETMLESRETIEDSLAEKDGKFVKFLYNSFVKHTTPLVNIFICNKYTASDEILDYATRLNNSIHSVVDMPEFSGIRKIETKLYIVENTKLQMLGTTDPIRLFPE